MKFSVCCSSPSIPPPIIDIAFGIDIGIVLEKGNKVPNGQVYLAYLEWVDIGNLSSPQTIADVYLAQSSPCNKVIDTLLKP